MGTLGLEPRAFHLAMTQINRRIPKDSPTVITVDAGCSSRLNYVPVLE